MPGHQVFSITLLSVAILSLTRNYMLDSLKAPLDSGAHRPVAKPGCPLPLDESWPFQHKQISRKSNQPGGCCWNWGHGKAAAGTAVSGVRTSPDGAADDNSASSFCRNQITSAQGGGYWQRILFLKLHLRHDRLQ